MTETSIQVLFEQINEQNKRIKKLKKENEQLTQDRNDMFIRERDALNELRDIKKENEQLKNTVEFVDKLNKMNERRLTRQAKHLEKIYKLIENKDWNGLTALYMDTKQDYEEII